VKEVLSFGALEMKLNNKWLLLVIGLLVAVIFSAPSDLIARSKWSRTRPKINLTHIFEGEINKRGRPVGFHARPGGRDPKNAKVVKIISPPNKVGVYTAKVKIYDKKRHQWKQKFSSFFPDKMSRKEVIDTILYAYKHRKHPKKQPWIGPSGKGFMIQGYLNKKGNINTAFPIYVKDKNYDTGRKKKKGFKFFY